MILISSFLSKGLEALEDILANRIFLSSGMGTTGYETRITLDGGDIFSTRVMEFLTEYWERNLILSGRVFVSHLQSFNAYIYIYLFGRMVSNKLHTLKLSSLSLIE